MRSNPFDILEYPYCHSGHDYAWDILDGKIIACKYIIGACKRYLRNLEDPKFRFDTEKAERYLRLVQKFEHVIGVWKTPNIVYMPWQNFIWMNIMGFYSNETGYRKYRIAHVEVARGNAKSAMASQAALYFLALDNPVGNQIATVASRKEQARIVLDSARNMATKAHSFRASTGVKVQAHSIVHDKSNSKVRALAADSTGLDGLNEVLAVCDELHAMDRKVFDVIYSGMSKRKDSLTLCITTAGFDVESVGYSQSIYAKKIALGEIEDEQFFSAVYTLDENDFPFDPTVWVKANPGYGDSVDTHTFEAKAKKAQDQASDKPNFLVKHLNMWLAEGKAFFDVGKWDLCADPTLKIEDFKGQSCIVAVDLASKVDLTSVVWTFKKDGIYYIFDKSFIPEQTVKDERNAFYENCIASGDLIATPGEAIHYPNIEQVVIESSKTFKIMQCLYDPWNATSFAQDLSNERIEMVEFRHNTANFSEPTKNLDALIRQGKIRHNGSKLLRWCLGNLVCKYDAADNVFPRKNNEKLKIDPVIAIIMTIASWMQEDQKISVYETQGIRFI